MHSFTILFESNFIYSTRKSTNNSILNGLENFRPTQDLDPNSYFNYIPTNYTLRTTTVHYRTLCTRNAGSIVKQHMFTLKIECYYSIVSQHYRTTDA